jgi:hypothetical protein
MAATDIVATTAAILSPILLAFESFAAIHALTYIHD